MSGPRARLAPRMFAACVLAATAAALWYSWKSGLSAAIGSGRPVFGLVIGTDWVDNARHSDTIVFVRYDPAGRALDLLSIPRDTRVDVPGLKVRRINEVYAYAFRASRRDHATASEELARAVEWLLFSSTRSSALQSALGDARPGVDFYVQIDYRGFKRLIDLLGGVPVTVHEPMHYDDNWGNLHIHFASGTHLLDGQKALEFVRFRGASGDAGRVSRQQEFLLSALGRFKNPVNLIKVPQLVWISLSAVQTNLSGFDRFLALWESRGLTRDRIRLMQLPGKVQKGYWVPDPDGVAATADLLVGGKRSAPEGAAGAPDAASGLTVEVWNASGKRGLALDVVHRLRARGFDVVRWGNYASRQPKTFVRDRRGDVRSARALAEALGPGKVEAFTRAESNPLVDLEVILGEDYGAGPAK